MEVIVGEDTPSPSHNNKENVGIFRKAKRLLPTFRRHAQIGTSATMVNGHHSSDDVILPSDGGAKQPVQQHNGSRNRKHQKRQEKLQRRREQEREKREAKGKQTHGRRRWSLPKQKKYHKSEEPIHSDYTYENGDKYSGWWRDNQKHGFGIATYSNGNSFRGNWQNDMRHGQGKYRFNCGAFYAGNWVEDCRHGQGKALFQTGGFYDGHWEADKLHGQGLMVWGEGDCYTGEWSCSQRSGWGTLVKLLSQGEKPPDISPAHPNMQAIPAVDNNNVNQSGSYSTSGELSTVPLGDDPLRASIETIQQTTDRGESKDDVGGSDLLGRLICYHGEWRNDVQHGKGMHIIGHKVYHCVYHNGEVVDIKVVSNPPADSLLPPQAVSALRKAEAITKNFPLLYTIISQNVNGRATTTATAVSSGGAAGSASAHPSSSGRVVGTPAVSGIRREGGEEEKDYRPATSTTPPAMGDFDDTPNIGSWNDTTQQQQQLQVHHQQHQTLKDDDESDASLSTPTYTHSTGIPDSLYVRRIRGSNISTTDDEHNAAGTVTVRQRRRFFGRFLRRR